MTRCIWGVHHISSSSNSQNDISSTKELCHLMGSYISLILWFLLQRLLGIVVLHATSLPVPACAHAAHPLSAVAGPKHSAYTGIRSSCFICSMFNEAANHIPPLGPYIPAFHSLHLAAHHVFLFFRIELYPHMHLASCGGPPSRTSCNASGGCLNCHSDIIRPAG